MPPTLAAQQGRRTQKPQRPDRATVARSRGPAGGVRRELCMFKVTALLSNVAKSIGLGPPEPGIDDRSLALQAESAIRSLEAPLTAALQKAGGGRFTLTFTAEHEAALNRVFGFVRTGPWKESDPQFGLDHSRSRAAIEAALAQWAAKKTGSPLAETRAHLSQSDMETARNYWSAAITVAPAMTPALSTFEAKAAAPTAKLEAIKLPAEAPVPQRDIYGTK